MSWYSGGGWPEYVTVAARQKQANKRIEKMRKKGRQINPVEIAGRKITTTFWGNAWCKNLEAYSDYENRLPRGRSYARNGFVLDLKIEPGCIHAMVSGSSIYDVTIKIKPLSKKKWADIKKECAGQIDSLVELLKGSISKNVMEIVTHMDKGLFPSPGEITLDCSCPDWATMCKHVAAALYGIGARLDNEPKLLFVLRGVDPLELIETALDQPAIDGRTRNNKSLKSDDLSSVFGVDINMENVQSSELPTLAKPVTRIKKVKKVKKAKTVKKVKKITPLRKKSVKQKNVPTTRSTAKKNVVKKKSIPKKVSVKKAAVKKKSISRKVSVKKAVVKKKSIPKKVSVKKAVVKKKSISKKVSVKKAAVKKKSV